MSSGFQSNYNDTGYTLTGTWYDESGNLITGPIISKDIYYTTEQIGVYMINGAYGSSNIYYPIYCSFQVGPWIGTNFNIDDAWLVYPGFGFTLSTSGYTSGTQSRNYVNTSTTPIVYYCGSTSGTGWVGYGTPILTTSGSAYGQNLTLSARIYFRGTEIFVNGIS